MIKWPGGKSKEIKYIADIIPKSYKRYIEPFTGGGAVFFHIEPKLACINDVDTDLINFYKLIQSRDTVFFDYLSSIRNDWDNLTNFANIIFNDFKYTMEQIRLENDKINQTLTKLIPPIITLLVNEIKKIEINLNDSLRKYIELNLNSKLKRIRKLEQQHDLIFNDELLFDHCETAIRAAFYTMIRDEKEPHNLQKETVKFYFIREFCYGSMFRFNSKGQFNIPYGGINYNHKDFRRKVNFLMNKEVIELLNNTEIFSLDFEEFLNNINPSKDDFLFFDPPYDSDFKDYSLNQFTQKDHKRLSKIFAELKSKSIMIIGHTSYIKDLYLNLIKEGKSIYISDYDKIYSYNVRGRNNRNKKHLLITNFEPQIADLSAYFDR